MFFLSNIRHRQVSTAVSTDLVIFQHWAVPLLTSVNDTSKHQHTHHIFAIYSTSFLCGYLIVGQVFLASLSGLNNSVVSKVQIRVRVVLEEFAPLVLVLDLLVVSLLTVAGPRLEVQEGRLWRWSLMLSLLKIAGQALEVKKGFLWKWLLVVAGLMDSHLVLCQSCPL